MAESQNTFIPPVEDASLSSKTAVLEPQEDTSLDEDIESKDEFLNASNELLALVSPYAGEDGPSDFEDIHAKFKLIEEGMKGEKIGSATLVINNLARARNHPQLKNLGIQALKRNFTLIANEAASLQSKGEQEPSFADIYFESASIMIKDPEFLEEDREKAYEFLKNNVDLSKKGLAAQANGRYMLFTDIMADIIEMKDPVVSGIYRKTLDSFMENDLTSGDYPYDEAVNLITRLLYSDNTTKTLLGYFYIRHFLEKHNLDYKQVLDSWSISSKEDELYEPIKENLVTIAKLEAQREGEGEGVCKVLSDTFGIHDFGRYPESMLMAQYEQRDTDLPYGVVFYPRSDHNGAFYQNKETFASFSEQLTALGYGVRIFEVGSTYDIARALLALDKKYGKKNKISFAFIGGHGEPDSIQFGDYSKVKTVLDQDDVSEGSWARAHDTTVIGRGMAKIDSFFIENPSVVLNSCSTGMDNGIGQEISKLLKGRVVAQDMPSNIKSITPYMQREDSGKEVLDFTVAYNDENSERMYVAGQKKQ